jgi:DNA-binding NarL/FixJ family response regulator
MSTSIVIAETADTPAAVAVVVVADDEVVRQRLANLVECIGHAGASIGVADIIIYGCHSFRAVEADAVRSLTREHPRAAVLVVSRGEDAARVRHALEAGASGYVSSDEVAYALAPAIAVVAAGQLSLPPAYRRQVAKPTFTTREKQILGLVVMGMSNGEIGRKLYLAESTVKSHLSSAFNKLGVRSRNEATAMILDPSSGLGPGILRITDDLPGTRRLAATTTP